MSSALAIAAVTATLKDLLNNGLIDHNLGVVGNFSVTAQPPDRITTGQTESNQVNLFLYQVTPNLGWRNAGLPARNTRGDRVGAPPLALDLHYLMSVYGAADLNAEVLLGYAMQLLHETPVLTRNQLRTSLAGNTVLPPNPQGPFGPHVAVDLADQVEQIKITPVYLSSEELSKLWTSMQARYRPSMAYLVSVVLIQRKDGVAAAPPVLQRGVDDSGPLAQAAPPPLLARVRPAASTQLPAARLGDDLALEGNALRGGAGVTLRLACARLDLERALPTTVDEAGVRARLPSVAEDADGMHEWGIGVYTAALRVAEPDLPVWTSNEVPLALAPTITVSPLNAAAGTLALTVTCTPRIAVAQYPHVRLLFGDRELRVADPASDIDTPADPLQPTTVTFSVPDVAAGHYMVRLRVDGIDSLPVVLAGTPVRFAVDPQQTVTAT